MTASQPMAARQKARSPVRWSVKLTARGWNQPTRRALEQIIRRGAGKGLPVVFDFDNTIVQGDIGEAVLAQLVRTGRLTAANVPPELCPPLVSPRGGRLSLRDGHAVTEYYERFLKPTAHGDDDPAPLANGYAWAVQVMAGLRLAEVVEATQAVVALSGRGKPTSIRPAPRAKAFPVPRLHPEMVELIAVLLQHGFDVWIVSASNVWSVRWMTLHALNPLLAARGVERGVAADHVVGVATLLADERGRLWKDAVLARLNSRHAELADPATSALRLTSQLQFPLPAYSGKVACILDHIGRRPYLCAGDGPGDLAMLEWSEHRLWIARWRGSQNAGPKGRLGPLETGRKWLVQVTREGPNGGFVNHSESDALPPE